MKDVVILTGAGQIGMAIARRVSMGKKLIIGDKSRANGEAITKIMNEAGFDAEFVECDLSLRGSILNLISEAQKFGEIAHLINGAGVSPSQAPIETLGAEIDEQLATTPTEELLALSVLQPENIRDTLHAYQLAKRCNVKRVMYEAVRWGERGARVNSISPGIIVTPLAIDEFNGIRGDFYKNMFAKCPAGRPGTADEVAALAEVMLDSRGAFITGSDFLIDGGATASYFYGPLKPQ